MPRKVQIDVDADTKDAVRGLGQVDKGLDDLGKTSSKSTLGLKQFAGGANEVVKGLTGMDLGTLSVAGGLYEMGKFLKSSVDDLVKYGGEVRALKTDIGATAEESSMLIQAADDMGIEFSSLQTALEVAIRKGVKPSIAGIGELSDQYLRIQDPIERTKFLMDNFGRSGADLARLMEQGADGITKLGEAAKATGMVLDDNALASAEAARVAYDELGDTWEGIKISVGANIVPVALTLKNLNDVLVALRNPTADLRGAWDKLIAGWNPLNIEVKSGVANFGDLRAVEMGVTDATNTLSGAMGGAATNAGLLNASMGELTKQLFFTQASAGLDADAALALARSLGLVNENTYTTLSQLDTLKKKYDTNADGAISAEEATQGYLDAVKQLGAAIDELHDKDVTVTVHHETIYNRSGENHAGVDEEFAEGGSMVVPPGHPNDDYTIGVSSGEQVNVTPPGKSSGGDVNIYGNITVVANDPVSFTNQLRNSRKSGAAYINR